MRYPASVAEAGRWGSWPFAERSVSHADPIEEMILCLWCLGVRGNLAKLDESANRKRSSLAGEKVTRERI